MEQDGVLCDNSQRLEAVNYYHKALHLGRYSSPRSAYDKVDVNHPFANSLPERAMMLLKIYAIKYYMLLAAFYVINIRNLCLLVNLNYRQ